MRVGGSGITPLQYSALYLLSLVTEPCEQVHCMLGIVHLVDIFRLFFSIV